MQAAAVLNLQAAQQSPDHRQPVHLPEQPSAPDAEWTHRLGFTALPREVRQDNSLAAYQSLLSEEASRMLLHASADGTHYPARSFLRTPHHLVPLVEACKTLQGLQSLDLSLNALSDAQLPQLQHLVEAGVQLTSLDLSHNEFRSQAAAPLCSIISHVSHRVRSHGTSQAAPQPVSRQAARSSEFAAQGSAGAEAAASQDLDTAAQESISQDVSSAALAASEGFQSAASSAAEGPSREGGSSNRSAGDASTSDSGPSSGVPVFVNTAQPHESGFP